MKPHRLLHPFLEDKVRTLGLLLCEVWPAFFGHQVAVLWLDLRGVSPGCESFHSKEFGPFVRCSRWVFPGCENLPQWEKWALLLQQRVDPHRLSEKCTDVCPRTIMEIHSVPMVSRQKLNAVLPNSLSLLSHTGPLRTLCF